MVQFGHWLADSTEGEDHRAFAKELLTEAITFEADIRTALEMSLVKNVTSGKPFFARCYSFCHPVIDLKIVQATLFTIRNPCLGYCST
jgi:hypothetical protein